MSAFKVTLSFDNGPEPEVTPSVLDVLRLHDVQATFFVLGEKLLDGTRKPLLRRAREEGHWIGNHTFRHVPLGTTPDRATAEFEIGRTQELIGDDAHESRLFRPTGGDGSIGPSLLSAAAANYLKEGGYSIALWNAVPEDWLNPDGWVDTAVKQCVSLKHAAVVLHDLPTGAMHNLACFIEEIRTRGGHFVQAFPESCMPLNKGVERSPLTPYVADPAFLSIKEC
ncbi:polysaccharide deacetylase family protein [Paraburkholderia terrae]|uniref:Polysaccharide deacetylase family protein n=1 Tax=Paraburkholderia terrae TaxID=311230 RepID=A0A2I8ETK7_9BURK|nr:polysaccharide deacetylase family protein [Paraburkholderia terrae]AUT62778.1 polysaccharide deacetylase family protein [Paraburkholderia terrae]